MMHCRKRYTSAACLALFLLSAAARAETLIYVKPGLIGTIDSANPAVDTTPGNNGPLGYTLPGGYTAHAAKVSDDGQTLYLLGALPPQNSNPGSTCQLFSVNPQGVNGVVEVTAVNGPYTCGLGFSPADLDFVQGSGSSSILDAYLTVGGLLTPAFEVPPGGALNLPPAGSTSAAPVSINWSGSAYLIGVANMSSTSATEQTGYGIDQFSGIVQVQLTITPEVVNPPPNQPVTPESITGTETVINPTVIPDPTQSGVIGGAIYSNSLDYSATSGYYYLYVSNAISLPPIGNGGLAFSTGAIYSTNSLNNGFTIIGSPPGAYDYTSTTAPDVPVAVVAAKGVSLYNNGNGGGAFNPAGLFVIALLTALRWRRLRSRG